MSNKHGENTCNFCAREGIKKQLRADAMNHHMSTHVESQFKGIGNDPVRKQRVLQNKITYIATGSNVQLLHIYCAICKKGASAIKRQDPEEFKQRHDKKDCPCKDQFEDVILPMLGESLSVEQIDEQIAVLKNKIEQLEKLRQACINEQQPPDL